MHSLRRRIVLAFLCLMTYTWVGGARAAEPVIWLALSEAGGAYAETADAIRAEIQRGAAARAELVTKPWRELVDGQGPPPRLVIAIGVGALRGLAESGPKVALLATLVPRSAYVRQVDAMSLSGRPYAALWLDQPAARQLDLLRLALPARQRIGVLLGPESRMVEPELLRAAAERNLTIAGVRIDGADQLPTALQRTLDAADVLLALPDPQIYNSATIQNVLTAAYRRRIPLAGFSPAYIKAGALLALYSTPLQVGTQVGEIVRIMLAGRPMPPSHGPREFSIGVNAEVARSLGITVDADAAARWTEQLRLKERGQ